MANNLFNEPNTPGVFDRRILAANAPQPLAVANPGRTYWYVENRTVSGKLFLSHANARGVGVGSISVPPGEARDSSVVPELTQAALTVAGDIADIEFTFIEVAAAQSAQS